MALFVTPVSASSTDPHRRLYRRMDFVWMTEQRQRFDLNAPSVTVVRSFYGKVWPQRTHYSLDAEVFVGR
jgi:hypothetical protein